jgi:DNA repair protein RadC
LEASTLSDVHQQISNYGEAFTNLRKVVELSIVIPVSSTSAERSFSTMRRIKTYLRATMQNPRLSNLALLSIDKENSEKLLKDPTPALDMFAKIKHRRLKFQI